MVKARKYPYKLKKRKNKKYEKIAKFKDKYCSKPRTQTGKVYKPSKETKQIFKLLIKTKTKPNFLRKANILIESIEKDIHNDYENKTNKWAKRINNEGKIEKHRGGLGGHPKAIFVKNAYGFEGQYTRAFLSGRYDIQIDNKYNINKIKGILLHEILHWIDDISHINNDGHDYLWRKRLDYFCKSLNYKGQILY